MKRRLACVAAALGLAIGLSRGSEPLEPPDLSRYIRWGPVRVRPGFGVSNLGHDDNVFSRTGGAPREGDLTVKLSPRVDGVVLLGSRAFLTFKEQFDYTAYKDHRSLNYFDQVGDARLTVPFRRIGVFTDLSFVRLKDSPASEIDTRPERQELRFGAGVILDLGARTDLEIARTHADWNHRDPDFSTPDGLTVADLLDRREEATRLKLRYGLSGSTRLMLDASWKTIEFDNRTVARDSMETQVRPGVEFRDGGWLSGFLSVGRARLDARDPDQADLSRVVGETRLGLRVSSRTRLLFDGTRRIGFAIYEGRRYFEETRGGVRATHWLNRRFGVEAAGYTGRLRFPDATASPRIDRLRGHELGLRVKLAQNAIGRRMEYHLLVGRRRRDSNIDALDLSRSTVGFGATVGY